LFKEVVIASLKSMALHLLRQAVEYHEKLQDNQFIIQESVMAPTEN
jgi:hypothetical protein